MARKDSTIVPIVKTARRHRQGMAVRKQQFLDHLAMSLETYIERYDEVPDALVVVMGGVFQTARVNYIIGGDSKRGTTSFLALAHVALARELIAPNGEDELAEEG